MSWSTSELRVRLAPLNRFKPSSKIFYWPFQGGTSFVDLLCFCSVLCLLCFVRVCLYVLCGHLLGKGWPLGSRLWCLLWVCHFPIGILGQVWYLIVSIPDLCTITYLKSTAIHTILEEGIMGAFLWNYLKFGQVVQEQMLFKEKVNWEDDGRTRDARWKLITIKKKQEGPRALDHSSESSYMRR